MFVLGLNHGEINSSAALVKDGRLLFGSPEERFNRQKRTKAFPRRSVEFCLGRAGIDLAGCEAVAQAWNPGAAWQKFNPMISGDRTRREEYFYAIPDNLMEIGGRKAPDWIRMDFDGKGNLPPVYYVQHHRTHAANAFFLSPFEEAAILTADFRGEFDCTSFAHGRDNEIEVLQTQHIPHSLGMFYATFTELLGYRPDNDEWKVMALSAFDVDCRELVERIRGTMHLGENGVFELDQSFYKGAIVDQPWLYTEKLVDLLGGRRGRAGEEPDEWHFSVARAMQIIAEDAATHFLNHLHRLIPCRSVVLGGGFFMNSAYNGKILDRTPFEEMYVSFAPADVGNSIGAAFYVAHCLHGTPRDRRFNSSYIGPAFDDAEIEAALVRRGIAHHRVDDVERAIAVLLGNGNIVAVFNGAMEFGERALGNRSILADPRRADMKDRINASIKYRESYRPFAPAVLSEKVSEYFDVPQGTGIPYMERVVPVRERFWDILPAVTHVDGSCRVQTVEKDHNPFFFGVIEKFAAITGIPVVLNTSFNINGEPIVLSPDDALSTFFNSGLDQLAIGNFIVEKK